jgi:glucose-6-phosphate isomerase
MNLFLFLVSCNIFRNEGENISAFLFSTSPQPFVITSTFPSPQEKNVSNMTLNISEINENTLGQLFLFLEASTAFIGEMLGINTFDQPGVERSKIITREILQK